MKSNDNNHALSLFKALRSMSGPDSEVHVELHEVCRATCLQEEDVRESVADLEQEGFITTEIVCHIADEWR
jgi:hypothetical protein